MEFNNDQKACIATLLYSDIFNFPLTDEELWHNLMSDRPIDKNMLVKTLKSLLKIITHHNGYYCLKGREEIIKQRLQRTNITLEKLTLAKNIIEYLAYIPTIQFIGLTGRLSHMDADIDDDIDLFFITKKNSAWITRILILSVLELLHVRRTRNDKNPKNKICPNLIIDESALTWPTAKHDIYTAHEIIQLYPLFERNNTYQKFLDSNKWVQQYYPNATARKQQDDIPQPKSYIVSKIISFTLILFENIAAKLQIMYMKKRKTTETILPNFLAFHPNDKHEEIVRKFSALIKKHRLKSNMVY